MKTKATLVATIFLFFSFNKPDIDPHGAIPIIENFHWLMDTWEMKTSKGSIFETWKKVDDHKLFGMSYAVEGKDTSIYETVTIVQKGEDLYYIPQVKDQNSGEPIEFKIIHVSASKFIAENRKHDYPQQISYTRIAKDQFVAEISGPVGDSYKYQTFNMNRYPSTEHKNIEIAKKVFKYFNDYDWDGMANLYAISSEFKDPSFGKEVVTQSRNQIIKKYQELNKIFPDVKDEIVAIYPSGNNQVIVEFVSSGTSPDGSKWKLPIVSIFTIENNLITKDYTYYDNQ